MKADNIKIIRFDETNQNLEALKGKWAQYGDRYGSFTVMKNILFVNLYKGASYSGLKLPDVYDGFVQCSDGSVVQVNDSILTCSLGADTTGFGVLVLKSWN